MKGNALCSWSGGKDSCYALLLAQKQGYIPKVLLNVLNEEGKISRSHGIPSEILQAQAEAAALPIHMIISSWQEYEIKFTAALSLLRDQFNLDHAIFGDIDLQAHRDWEEKVCTNAGLEAILPLWQMDRAELVNQMLGAGIKTMIVSCNEKMGERFLGRIITPQLLEELSSLDIDPCGENGEYHTLVLDCPLFAREILVDITGTANHDNYWFGQLRKIT